MNYAKKVDEDAKILALKSIMPDALFGEVGVFRGRSFNLYADLRTITINYLDGKVPVSMMKQVHQYQQRTWFRTRAEEIKENKEKTKR